jgi:acyl carrier protein
MWLFKRKRKENILDKEKQKLFVKIKDTLAKEFKIPAERITCESRFREDFIFDSVDTIQANIVLEEIFGLVIPDEDIEKILTVQDLVEYLHSRLKEKIDD